MDQKEADCVPVLMSSVLFPDTSAPAWLKMTRCLKGHLSSQRTSVFNSIYGTLFIPEGQ